MTTTPLEGEWKAFAEASVQPGTPDWQRAEMRRIFFAGALSMQALLVDAKDDALDAIAAELFAFGDEVMALADTPPAGNS